MAQNKEIVFKRQCDVAIEDCPIQLPKQNELLIKTDCTLISTGTELTILEGKDIPSNSVWNKFSGFPSRPGYNNIGVVVDTGEGVEKSWIGKKVATCGRHAMYVTAGVQDARPVPSGIKDEHAAFFTLAEIAMNGVRRGGVSWGETAVIFGLGIIGQLAVRFCRMCGAQNVIAVDISDFRLGLLPENIHITPVNADRLDVADRVKTITKGRMADVVYEVTGVAALIPDEFKVLRRQGRFVILSSPRGITQFDFHDLCNSTSQTIIGAHNSSHPRFETPDNPWTNKRDCEFFFDMIISKDIDIEPLISHKVHYTKAISAYDELMKDRTKTMGVVLEWE